MRNEIPIMHRSSHTPKFSAPGVYLKGSHFHGGTQNTAAAWIHGVLVIERGEDEAEWMKSLNLTAVSESNQFPQIEKLFARRIVLQNHFEDAALGDDRPARILPFSLDLRDVLGEGLYDDNFFVHVSARRFCTTPVRIVITDAELASFLENAEAAESQHQVVDLLLKAYDASSGKRYAEAVKFFSAALENEALRADPDRPNLYNAAYCAGQALLEAAPQQTEPLVGQTARWLEEDLKMKNSLLENIQKLLASESEESVTAELGAQRRQLLEDLGLAAVAAPNDEKIDEQPDLL